LSSSVPRANAGDQGVGLVLLVVGLAALVVGAPFHSLAALLVGALAAGTGHGVAFLNAQQELNDLAPAERRGEVTAAFISCIYFLVATSVITTGALDRAFSLTLSVAAVAIGLIVVAATVTVWQWRGPESNRRHHGFQPCALPTELPRPDGEV
jgi:MFS family permease